MEINGEQVNGTKTYAELGLSEAIMRAIAEMLIRQAHRGWDEDDDSDSDDE